MERTFAIIKPDAVAAGKAGAILAKIEENGFQDSRNEDDAAEPGAGRRFLRRTQRAAFFKSLVTFMTEGPVVVLALEREDAIAKWRELMGATNPANAAEGTIRKQFAESIERNAIARLGCAGNRCDRDSLLLRCFRAAVERSVHYTRRPAATVSGGCALLRGRQSHRQHQAPRHHRMHRGLGIVARLLHMPG